jgi:hypothetical protein
MDADARAKVEARGKIGLGRGCLTRHAHVLIGERGEIGAVALKGRRADIGQIVGDDPHAGVLGVQTCAGDLKCIGRHRAFPFSGNGLRTGQAQQRRAGLIDLLGRGDHFVRMS